MSRKQKGFSLLELLVSMLIVSIAMLGFAGLQAYSSRALSGTFARTSETAVFNEFVKLFQVSSIAVSKLQWPASNTINFTCGNADTLTYADGSTSALASGVEDICAQLARVRGIVASDIAFSLQRQNNNGLDSLVAYSLTISFAYIPKKAGVRTDQTADVTPTVARFCPINGPTDTEELNRLRVAEGVVCSKVEVML